MCRPRSGQQETFDLWPLTPGWRCVLKLSAANPLVTPLTLNCWMANNLLTLESIKTSAVYCRPELNQDSQRSADVSHCVYLDKISCKKYNRKVKQTKLVFSPDGRVQTRLGKALETLLLSGCRTKRKWNYRLHACGLNLRRNRCRHLETSDAGLGLIGCAVVRRFLIRKQAHSQSERGAITWLFKC